ncbi:HAMP domain-containing sensor histidine kinase [Pseudogracilibacillus sp. SO30301A]|uniref:HAMP domain-containing sensor histidine kinase n=1 Tax=Pseudogracilibacillus sp. SO30301A TaxID=3098291 RepID=UPI00300E0A4A
MRFLRSLLAKYMLIIITAIFLLQIIIIITAMLFFNTWTEKDDEKMEPVYIEETWHDEASSMTKINEATVSDLFEKWKQNYPDASMFWIDDNGKLILERDVNEGVPTNWSATTTAKYIKERYDSDPFTVISFLGAKQDAGFIVFEIPRHSLNKADNEKYSDALLVIGVIIILLFVCISFLFFRNIRKRLLYVQEAMEIRDVDDLPVQIDVKKQDEIGQLEQTFNEMVVELKDSKKREEEEEELRRSLIANLSHDLRTPLTKINANIFTLKKEVESEEGKKTLKVIEESIKSVDELIENLMSYTLLMASKYKHDPKDLDVIRFVRTSLASWYPLFEQENFMVDIDLNNFKENKWYVDPLWLERILDNIFQNVLRHANSGKFIGVYTESTTKYDAIIIKDRGQGMNKESAETGAGIGLSIVDMMISGLGLSWELDSTIYGTTIKIKRNKNETRTNML